MQEELFSSPTTQGTDKSDRHLPLASRMRPRTLDEYVGQTHVLGPGMPTREAILQGKLGSLVLWAPPGCGKTTLALIIGKHAGAHVEIRSAVTAGVADVRDIAKSADQRRKQLKQKTLLLLDEIHHFNRSQQDSLLGLLEDGTIVLIGATTENPFFVLNNALLSRVQVLPLKPLGDQDISDLLQRALIDNERGLGERQISLSEEALTYLLSVAGGDARLALNGLETASMLVPNGAKIELAQVEQVFHKKAVRYDRQGDYHYDTISAFIKSLRGSDPDAAIHYLARMLEAGEDPRFVARRMVILASEDVSNADPHALTLAVSAHQAVERVGMPEARIILAQCAAYLALAPKDNASYLAIDKALEDVRTKPLTSIPLHLSNAPVDGLKELGHAQGYKYPHDFEDHWVEQTYMPEGKWSLPYYNAARHQKRKTRKDSEGQ